MTQDLNDIHIFIAAVEAGSVRKAARALKLNTTSALKKLAHLESAIGKPLFKRSTTALTLSTAGQQYFEHCLHITNISHLPALIQSCEKTLKLGTSQCIGQNYLQLKLAPFIQRYDTLSMNMYSLTKSVDMHKQDFDLAVLTQPLNDCRLNSLKLGTSKLRLYASPKYLRACAEPISVNMLRQHALLLPNARYTSNKLALVAAHTHKIIQVTPKLQSDDFNMLRRCAISGMGVAMLPDYMCQQELLNGSLVNILDEWGGEEQDICAYYPEHKTFSAATESLLALIVDALKPASSVIYLDPVIQRETNA